MKQTISDLNNLKETFKNSPIQSILDQKIHTLKSKTKSLESELLELEQNIKLKERKKVMHKTDILKNKVLAEKNDEKYIIENNKQLENCQEQVKLETMIYNIEMEIEYLKANIKECNEKLVDNKVCLHDKIFLELIKGVGVEYNEAEQSFFVRNTVRNEICTFKADDKELTEKIWKFLGP